MIGVLGISHKSGSLDFREKFSFSKEEILPFSEFVFRNTGIEYLVVLSTCNRTELYFSQDTMHDNVVFDALLKSLTEFKRVSEPCQSYFYRHSEAEAARHLFEVTSGMDSMVIGEDQIVGQIKDAYVYCTEQSLTDAVLMRLFQKAFEAGKRVRTDTGIKLGGVSVSQVAVELCAKKMDELPAKTVCLLGAGETGSLALANLTKKGVTNVMISNRTFGKAQKLAERYHDTAFRIEELPERLPLFDIIIVATGSKHHLIDFQMAQAALQKRQGVPQLYVDLSVPRNIQQEVANLDGVQLYCVDDLQGMIEANTEKRRQCLGLARKIIRDSVTDFMDWVESRSLRPTIRAITHQLQRIHQEELSGYRKFDNPEMQELLNDYAQHLTNRYTRLLIKNLKEVTNNGRNADYLKAVHELFRAD